MGSIFLPSYWMRMIKKMIRVALAASRGFSEDDCSLKASALTYYSILSIVPVLAVAFGIAKGFGFEKHLEKEVVAKFFDQRELADNIIHFAYSALQGAQGGLIAGIGTIVLLWTVIKLLSNIESSFNAIWKIRQLRPLARRFNDYLALMIFCPLFFAISSSLSIFIVTQVSHYSHDNGLWDTVSPLITLAFQLFPILLSWLFFSALYIVMPNTRVPIRCAVLAGIIAGTAFQIVQWAYINFQLGITSYNAIYGSFAVLPLLIVWINLSWLITLFGAEIACHAENDIPFPKNKMTAEHVEVDERIVGLSIVDKCCEAFRRNSPPLTIYDIARNVGINTIVARNIVEQLRSNGILSEVRWENNAEMRYQPGREIKNITLKMVCDTLNPARHTFYTTLRDERMDQFQQALQNLDISMEQRPENTLFAIIEQEQSR